MLCSAGGDFHGEAASVVPVSDDVDVVMLPGSPQVANRISDQRSIPSDADHHDILATFQQDLSCVDEVILFDNESCVSDFEFDHLLQAESRFFYRLYLRLREARHLLCECHVADALRVALPCLMPY